MQKTKPEPEAKAEAAGSTPQKRGTGGRPKNEPGKVRDVTIGVRVAPEELVTLKAKADAMGMTQAKWLREAALTRRLPSPPVPEINRAQYAELARLSSNLNQLTRIANEGRNVTVNVRLLERLDVEVGRLRQALLGVGATDDS